MQSIGHNNEIIAIIGIEIVTYNYNAHVCVCMCLCVITRK